MFVEVSKKKIKNIYIYLIYLLCNTLCIDCRYNKKKKTIYMCDPITGVQLYIRRMDNGTPDSGTTLNSMHNNPSDGNFYFDSYNFTTRQ